MYLQKKLCFDAITLKICNLKIWKIEVNILFFKHVILGFEIGIITTLRHCNQSKHLKQVP